MVIYCEDDVEKILRKYYYPYGNLILAIRDGKLILGVYNHPSGKNGFNENCTFPVEYILPVINGHIAAENNTIQFILDTGERVRIEREPFAVEIDGAVFKPFDNMWMASQQLTGAIGEKCGVFTGRNCSSEAFTYKKEKSRQFEFAGIRYSADPAPRIISQLKLRIKAVRAWVESLVAEEAARKAGDAIA